MKESIRKYQQSERYKKYKSEYNKKRYLNQKKEKYLNLFNNDNETIDKIIKANSLSELKKICRKKFSKELV